MEFRNPVSVVTPVDGVHATNKDYVDGKQVTISWADYQALSEEEKCNGALYDIPDMPTAGQGGIITTYTALEQLGLSAGASVADMVNAMPDCSYAEIGCHREENPYGLEHITGLPSEDGNFILTVRKYNLYRVDIQAKTSASGAVMNDLYIGGMLANDTTVEWRRVCTTTVKDVELTNWDISVTDKFAVCTANKNTYSVKNAICVFNISLECKVANTGSTVNVKSNLPVPVANVTARIMGTTGTSSIQVNISKSDGSMSINGGAKGIIYEGQLVYILKNS